MGALTNSVNDLRGNEKQWEAFQVEGHCVVLAPPGSGKTKLLTTRMAYDLANKIPRPQGAACITLTNAAAEELRRRVELLGVENRPTLFIGTVHSFAIQRVITPFARMVGRPELANISIASETQITAAFRSAIDQVYGPWQEIRYVESTISFNRRRLATDEDWAKQPEEIRAVARQYTERLREQGLHDFLDIVEIAVDFVEHHPVIRRVLTAEYPHLYVDEYQDLAPGLDRLVKALCFDYSISSELFAVGDPDQAVFAFTGTRPELLHELAGRFDVTSVELEHNYRCGEAIIRAANMMRQDRPAIKGDRPGGSVSAINCPSGFEEQALRAATYAGELQERGVPLHEVAVLCPTNAQCKEATDVLRSRGIPAFVRGDEYRATSATSFVEGCAAWATLGREISNYRLGALMRRWNLLLGPDALASDDAALTKLLMDARDRGNDRAIALLDDLLQLGMKRGLDRPGLADDLVEIRKMRRALDGGTLKDMTISSLAERARKVDRVEVTTMNASKGLEFDVVLMLGVDEKWVPHFASMKDPDQLAEDRRKFYVSITRARDEVRIHYSGFVTWKNGTSIDRAGPSRFLREIGLLPARQANSLGRWPMKG
jgi:DNA helicase-2/ATP-dependent DNA helicase PcrA